MTMTTMNGNQIMPQMDLPRMLELHVSDLIERNMTFCSPLSGSSTAKAKASNLFKSRKRTLDSNDSDNDSEANEPDTKTRKVSETRKVSASSSRSASSKKLRFSQSDEESETSETRETSSGLQPITPSPRFIATSRYSSWKTKEDISKSKIGPWDHGYVMPLPYFSSF
ncbi:hypothetical protein C8J56DRAFT_68890 [Mycena floridula]|nr:hypothetical protein C8J56DRAFT_68890 [Mycena floridula]